MSPPGDRHGLPTANRLILCAAVTLWVGGFDVLYACQDIDFDRHAGLYSIPQRFGIDTALLIARVMHSCVIALLAWLAAHKPPMLHLIITGRDAPRALIEAADLVTEMREVKHPLHTQGIRAQKGIEF